MGVGVLIPAEGRLVWLGEELRGSQPRGVALSLGVAPSRGSLRPPLLQVEPWVGPLVVPVPGVRNHPMERSWSVVRKPEKKNEIILKTGPFIKCGYFELMPTYLLVISPSQAGLSHSSSWRIFSSARDLFPLSSKIIFSSKIGQIGIFHHLIFFFLFSPAFS